MFAGSLAIVAALLSQAECFFARSAARAEVSTPAPTSPWTNSSRSVPNTVSPCPTCQNPDLSRASECSQSQRLWSSSSSSWHREHFTVTQSILPTYVTVTRYSLAPSPTQSALQQCANSRPYCVVTNQINVTIVKTQYAAEADAARRAGDLYDFSPRQPQCVISQYECQLLLDDYAKNSTGKAEPDCKTVVSNVCFPAYALSSMKSLIIPTFTWIIPTASPTGSGRNPKTIPKNKWAPDGQTTQPEPQQPKPPPPPPPAQEAPPRAPVTTVVTVEGTAITATVYSASSGKAMTAPPSAVISGKTLAPAAPPLTIGPITLSLAPPEGALVLVSATSTLPFRGRVTKSGLEASLTTEVVVLSDQVYTATASGSVIIFSSGLTATMGGPLLTLPHNIAVATGVSPMAGPHGPQGTAPPQASPATDDQDTVISLAPNGDILVVAQSTLVPAPTSTSSFIATDSSFPETEAPRDSLGAASSTIKVPSSQATQGAAVISYGPVGLGTPTANNPVNGGFLTAQATASLASGSEGSIGGQGEINASNQQGHAANLLVPKATELLATTFTTLIFAHFFI